MHGLDKLNLQQLLNMLIFSNVTI